MLAWVAWIALAPTPAHAQSVCSSRPGIPTSYTPSTTYSCSVAPFTLCYGTVTCGSILPCTGGQLLDPCTCSMSGTCPCFGPYSCAASTSWPPNGCSKCGDDDERCDGHDNNSDGVVDDNCDVGVAEPRAGGSAGGAGTTPCTEARCSCEAVRAEPVSVGTGRHALHPIEIVAVRGPWTVPLEFRLYHATANGWGPRLDERAATGVAEHDYFGPSWSHTFSEAVAVFEADTPSAYGKRVDPAHPSSPLVWPTTVCGATSGGVTGYRFRYRTETGRSFGYAYATSGDGLVNCQQIAEGALERVILSSERGAPYALHVLVNATTRQTDHFEVRDLARAVTTSFDAHGRVVSKKARTPSGGWFGWTATRNASGALVQVAHDTGHVLTFVPVDGGAAFGAYASTVTLTPPGGTATTYGTFTRTDTLQQAVVPRGTWLFEYHPTLAGRTDPTRLARVVDPSGTEILKVSYPAWPTCNIGAIVQQRARAVTDRDGRWEFRRRGTALADTNVCSGTTAVADATALYNPCASGSTPGIAVLNVNQRQQASNGSPVTCTPDSTTATTCGAGYLCSDWADASNQHYCVRYMCQRTTAGRADEPTELSEGCGCSNTASLAWQSVGTVGAQPLRRIAQRLDQNGRATTYLHDSQGRVIAECVGDNDSVVDAVSPASCGPGGEWHHWIYGDLNFPWAISGYEQSTVLGPSPSTNRVTFSYVRDATTGLVTSATEVGYTYTTLAGVIGTQTRQATYSYAANSGILTQVSGPGDALTTYTLYGSSAGASAFQIYTEQTRSERADGVGGTTTNLTTTYASYSRVGEVTSRTDPDGVTLGWTFDAWDRQVDVTRAGRTYHFNYDASGRVFSVRRPSGQAFVYGYLQDMYGHPSQSAYRVLRADVPDLNGSGEVTGASNADYLDDANGEPSWIFNDRRAGRRTGGVDATPWLREQQRADDRQRMQAVQNFATGQSTSYTYAAGTGLLSDVTDALGHRTHYTRDSFGRISMITRDADSSSPATTMLGYTGVGSQATTVTQPNGVVVQYTFDDFGERVRTTSVDIGTLRTRYDARGRRAEQLEADATRTAFTYDRASRLIAVDYDADHTTAAANDTRYWYDALPSALTCPAHATCGNLAGRLALVETDITTPTYRTYYGYTAAGETASEAIQIGTDVYPTTYTYDAAGRMLTEYYPLGTGDQLRFAYNTPEEPGDAEQVVAIEDWIGGSASDPYTPAPTFFAKLVDRVERYPNGPIRRMWYAQHALGGARATNPSVERTRRQDGTPDAATWRGGTSAGVDLGTYQYGYNNDGSIASITRAGGTASDNFFYQYDGLGRLTCASGAAASGACTSGTPNLLGLYTYDTSGNRTSSLTEPNPVLHNYGLVTNSNRLASVTQAGAPSGVQYAWGTGMYLGGAPGQRVSETWPAPSGGGAAPQRFFAYWPSGQVKSIQVVDGRGTTSVLSGYDHRGRRAFNATIQADGTRIDRLFFYDLAGHLVAVRSASSATSTPVRDELYAWADDEPVMRWVLSNVTTTVEETFLYNDHLGTPKLALQVWPLYGTIPAPTVIYRAPREPFVASNPLQSPTSPYEPVRLRFPGQWIDQESSVQDANGNLVNQAMVGMINNHSRAFDPGIGAYSSFDPIFAYSSPSSTTTNTFDFADPTDLNIDASSQYSPVHGNHLYSYAVSRPTEVVDPTGGSSIDYNPDQCEPQRQWVCTAKCGLEGTGPQCQNTWVYGRASGSNEAITCADAKGDASSQAPRGCRTKHCRCDCRRV